MISESKGEKKIKNYERSKTKSKPVSIKFLDVSLSRSENRYQQFVSLFFNKLNK